jgi:hypothetical protein
MRRPLMTSSSLLARRRDFIHHLAKMRHGQKPVGIAS